LRILIDTNILVRLRDNKSPHHEICQAALDHLREEHSAQTYLCAQVLIEYWAVATRPIEVNGLGLSTAQTARDIFDMEQVFRCLPEPPDIAKRWLDTVRTHDVQGKQTHDARLVAFVQASGITHLLTLNTADFVRYQEITVLSPENALNL
jgi:predicted nucleic acid-binding protein